MTSHGVGPTSLGQSASPTVLGRTGAFGCWLLSPSRTQSELLPYPGAAGPAYLRRDEVDVPFDELLRSAAGNIRAVAHITVVPGDPHIVPPSSLTAHALEAGECLLVTLVERQELWVARVDEVERRPSTVWHTVPIEIRPPSGGGTERADFERALLRTGEDVSALCLQLTPRQAHLTSKPSLAPLPARVPRELVASIQRITLLEHQLVDAWQAAQERATTAGRARAEGLADLLSPSAELRQTLRRYTDALWNQALGACQRSSLS